MKIRNVVATKIFHELFEVQDRFFLEEKDCDETCTFPLELCDGLVSSYFAREHDEPVTDII